MNYHLACFGVHVGGLTGATGAHNHKRPTTWGKVFFPLHSHRVLRRLNLQPRNVGKELNGSCNLGMESGLSVFWFVVVHVLVIGIAVGPAIIIIHTTWIAFVLMVT